MNLYGFRSLDAVQLPKCDDSFSSSAESVHCSDEYLVLHPKPETNQIYDATVITALSPSLFYVSLKQIAVVLPQN